MGSVCNLSKLFLFPFFVFSIFYSHSCGSMGSDSSWRVTTALELAELKKNPAFNQLLTEKLEYRNQHETREATVGDILINDEGLFKWVIPDIIPPNNGRRTEAARNESSRRERVRLNEKIGHLHATHTKAETLAEENARLKEENEKLLEKIRLGYRDEDVIIKVLQTQILELQEILAKHGFHVDVNMDVLGGPSRDVSRGAIIAANPYISIVEQIQNSVQRQLKEAQQKNAQLLSQLEAKDKNLAAQIAENRRLKIERDEWEFKANQRLAQLEIAQQALTDAERAMEHKWTEAMRVQNKLIQDLAAANHRLSKKEQENPDGMAALDAIGPSAKAIAHTVITSPQLVKGKVKKLAEKLAKNKEDLKAEQRKNVEMGRRVREFVRQLEELTKEREAQKARIREQNTTINSLTQAIQRLEVDSDRFVASNQRLRAQLGEINELLPVPEDGASSSNGPVNVLDSLKERLALYMQNVEQKQVELRRLQEKDEESQGVIQQWVAWQEATIREMRAYEEEARAEIVSLNTILQHRETELGEVEESLAEAGEINEALLDDIRTLEAERTLLEAFLDKWAPDMRTLPQSQSTSNIDTDTSVGGMSTPTVIVGTSGVLAAAEAERAQDRLAFIQTMQKAEEELIAAEETYQAARDEELFKREEGLRKQEEELRERREAVEKRRQDLEAREKQFEEKQGVLAELQSNVAALQKKVREEELAFGLRWQKLERDMAHTQGEEEFLGGRLTSLQRSAAEERGIDVGIGTAIVEGVGTSTGLRMLPTSGQAAPAGNSEGRSMDVSTTLRMVDETRGETSLTGDAAASTTVGSSVLSPMSPGTLGEGNGSGGEEESVHSVPGRIIPLLGGSYSNAEVITGDDGSLPAKLESRPVRGHSRSTTAFGEV